ncbi:MAG: FKBP-type peptidyl-prolyl cis-trans isomerase [Planctomycetes bacterium]|nr:FKBP-type peptidyl-prolyl cis-trans isomerase [Planctomycetota bacterium]
MNKLILPLAIVVFIGVILLYVSSQKQSGLNAPPAPTPNTATPGVTETQPKKALTTYEEKLSYIYGLEIGGNFKQLDKGVDFQSFCQGVDDFLKGNKPVISQEEAMAIRNEWVARQQSKQPPPSAQMAELAEKNLKEGEAFLAENKGKEGVMTTASGLQYVILVKGDGPQPKLTDTVRVHYRGTLIDGTVFDSSYDRGVPAEFQVGGVIKGWIEALQLMNVGSKYKLFIPSNIAYGMNPRPGGPIGPNTMLIFEVELLEIVTK